MPSIADKNNLEVGSDKPKLHVIREEIQQALTDTSYYYSRCQDIYDRWHSRWNGQTVDGRKHAGPDGESPFPWENASDTRVRLCELVVKQFEGIATTTFFKARVQATSTVPFSSGREANQGTTLLKWMLYSHMRGELLEEVPLGFNWWAGYGASLMRVGWVQEKRVQWHDLDVQLLAEFIQLSGGPEVNESMQNLFEMLHNPEEEDVLVNLVMSLDRSGNLTMNQSRKIVGDLRTEGKAKVPVPYVFKNQPSWCARRLGVDVLVPRSTRNIQQAPWVVEREWVTETVLRSRVMTDDYRQDFVDELLKRRGETDNPIWNARTAQERGMYSGTGNTYYSSGSTGEFRNQFELFHAEYKTIDELGYPCVYTTTFSPLLLAKARTSDQNLLYAKHGPTGFDHGQYNYTPLRFELNEPELMSSRGVPELAFTWEDEIKVQRDGRTDMTALIHRPPMIVPFMRQQAIKSAPVPGSVYGTTRPNEVSWMTPPVQSNVPVELENSVRHNSNEFFGIFGVDVDPEWKGICREKLVGYILGWSCLTIDQTFQLLQQFEADEEVQAVVGQLRRPFHIDPAAIQQKHEITAVFDPKMLNEEYAITKMDLFIKAVQMDTSGRWDMSIVSEIAAEMVDPALVDRALRPAEVVTDQETKDEKAAIAAAMSGVEMPAPKHGNFQLRLKVLTDTVQNPQVMQELEAKPFSKQIIQQRFKYFSAQIQQYQNNPEIGRTLATGAQDPTRALPTTTTQGALA